MFNNKNIIVGISGGIAAYKSVNLIRLLIKNGAHVKVVVTANALQFVTKVTLESISQHKVYSDVFDAENDYTTAHVSLTDWGDMFVVAPATANIIGKFASGIADDALSTSLLAFDKDIFIAPAMNCKMWDNFAVRKNCYYLKENGIHFIEPESGFLACGYDGKGRMAEPETIVASLENFLNNNKALIGKKAMVTAGPTYEAIDPVRYIGNHASGLMGFSLSEALADAGAEVTLISGPTKLKTHHKNINTIAVVSAEEMLNACLEHFPENDITVMAAAVADYKPAAFSSQKIKKSRSVLSDLPLVETTDILKELGKIKNQNQLLVGFALETENETENAYRKLKEKNLDFIVLNSLNCEGAGFGTPTNKVTIIDHLETVPYELKSKKDVAVDIVNKICKSFIK